MLGNRPSPELISFAPECFETVGVETYWVVATLAPNYPHRFGSKAEAEAFAKKTGRVVTEKTAPIRKRVKWS